jgi:hypothetical protein
VKINILASPTIATQTGISDETGSSNFIDD